MIVYKIKSQMDIKGGREGRRITLDTVAEETGISDATLRSINGRRGYNTTMKQIDALCRYFACQPGDLMVFIDPPETSPDTRKSRNKKRGVITDVER